MLVSETVKDDQIVPGVGWGKLGVSLCCLCSLGPECLIPW